MWCDAMQKVRFWDPEHWRLRAEETRTVADQMHHEESRTIMRRIALDYDRLVKFAEEQLALPAPMHSWDQMKPRTVYEKAVQDFTETARQLARLNQHFRQASFAEFEMLMGVDDGVLKRYGLPKPMVERALIEVYETVVLGQQRYRDHP